MEHEYTESMHEVFTPRIRLKNGKIIYPKNGKVFHFWAKDRLPEEKSSKQISLFDDTQGT